MSKCVEKSRIPEGELDPDGKSERERVLERQLWRLREDVRAARVWAGDNLPANQGLVMVEKLEKALGSERD
ncbi:hypothetical protein [Halomonas sp. MMSF_3323]|uniref:hypothetical protein n=1 Tax=Halomonas sp. MMSF_3323 TaxID=3046701 RepID=UPI00273E2A89|nr:hypothetical protein [Halomonas sp. MMSF_3323]